MSETVYNAAITLCHDPDIQSLQCWASEKHCSLDAIWNWTPNLGYGTQKLKPFCLAPTTDVEIRSVGVVKEKGSSVLLNELHYTCMCRIRTCMWNISLVQHSLVLSPWRQSDVCSTLMSGAYVTLASGGIYKDIYRVRYRMFRESDTSRSRGRIRGVQGVRYITFRESDTWRSGGQIHGVQGSDTWSSEGQIHGVQGSDTSRSESHIHGVQGVKHITFRGTNTGCSGGQIHYFQGSDTGCSGGQIQGVYGVRYIAFRMLDTSRSGVRYITFRGQIHHVQGADTSRSGGQIHRVQGVRYIVFSFKVRWRSGSTLFRKSDSRSPWGSGSWFQGKMQGIYRGF